MKIKIDAIILFYNSLSLGYLKFIHSHIITYDMQYNAC